MYLKYLIYKMIFQYHNLLNMVKIIQIKYYIIIKNHSIIILNLHTKNLLHNFLFLLEINIFNYLLLLLICYYYYLFDTMFLEYLFFLL